MPPASRLTDVHTCPFAGGPVVSPCVPTVLIGNMPAAVLGDTCTCAMGADLIVKGSMTVTTGGRPQARIGDQTTSGGVLITGWFTVIVGG